MKVTHKIGLICLAALIVRLLFVLVLDPHPMMTGGDMEWYMGVGHELVTTGTTRGPIQPPPLFPLFLGLVQQLVPDSISSASEYGYPYAEIQTIRILQAGMGAALCFFVYVIARRLFSQRVGLWAAAAIAFNPVFVIESGNIATESMFLFLFYAGLALYVGSSDHVRPRILMAVGTLLALATLTRAVALLFPLVIIAHLLFHDRRRWLPACILLTYVPLVSTWTIYNIVEWDRVVIGGEGFMSFLYQGAEGVGSPEEIDQQLGVTGGAPGEDVQQRSDALNREVRESILENPVGWMVHRVTELASAYVQPHNTNYFQGRSIKDAASSWLRNDRSLSGLRDVVGIRNFAPKLVLYIFHFAALALGAAGMLVAARRWRALLVLYGVVAYFTGIHFALLALPRYLFPMMPAWIIFACAAVAWWWGKRRSAADQRC